MEALMCIAVVLGSVRMLCAVCKKYTTQERAKINNREVFRCKNCGNVHGGKEL